MRTLGLLVVLVMAAGVMLVVRLVLPQIATGDSSIARVAQIQANSGAYIENAGTPIFDNQIVRVPPPRVAPTIASRVLGIASVSDEDTRWIEVDVSDQRLTTWEKTQKVKDYPVSTGIAGSPTVLGEFRVWRKVLLQGYRGGSKDQGTYYYLPNVPYSLFFHKGYAIHAAYWHNDFGIRPRSHGCVNMRVEDAKEVYEWANPVMPAGLRAFNAEETNPGTRIVIHD